METLTNTTVVGILQQLVLELKMDPETLTEEEKKSDEALSAKTKELMVRNRKRMAEREQYRKVLSSDYHSLFLLLSLSFSFCFSSRHVCVNQTENMTLFLDVLRSDATNEAYPLAKKRTVGGGASLKRCSSGFL